MDIRLPRYMDYVGNFLICILWIAIIRYLVFENVHQRRLGVSLKQEQVW